MYPSRLALILSCALLGGILGACTPRAADPIPEESAQEATDEGSADPDEAADEGSGPTEALPPEPTTHVVVPGDTLWGIAIANNCSVDAIKQASNLSSDVIFPGQRLLVPTCGTTTPPAVADSPSPPPVAERPAPREPGAGETVHQIRPGDYLERIAQTYGCSVSEVMVANRLDNDVIYAGQELIIPACTGAQVQAAAPARAGEIVVQPGDALFNIAARAGCSVEEIMVENDLHGDLIRAGQRLRIPSNCTGASSGAPIASSSRTTDTTTLPRLMRERSFSPPRGFKALVLEITFDNSRQRVVRERAFAYGRTATETDWNPASSIKLFAAIAAMQKARRLGVSIDARLTYHSRRERTFSLRELIDQAIGPSDNIAYNRLVQFVGWDELNSQFLSARNGIRGTALQRPYEQTEWMRQGEGSSFRDTPAITVRDGRRTVEVPARRGSAATGCGGAACTTLNDLAEMMRRLMLQEQLPASQTFDLPRNELLILRGTMRSERRRGDEVVDALARSFSADSRLYHKAGFAGEWYSDNIYIFDPRRGQAWIVTMAGYPGRSSLTSAARIIGSLIADGTLGRN